MKVIQKAREGTSWTHAVSRRWAIAWAALFLVADLAPAQTPPPAIPPPRNVPPVIRPGQTNRPAVTPSAATNSPAAVQREAQEPVPVPTIPNVPPGLNPLQRGANALSRREAAREGAAKLANGIDPDALVPEATMQMNGMDVGSLFEIYTEISGRIVLRSSTIGDKGTVSLKVTVPLTYAEAVQTLDALLAQNGITMVPLGDKWVKAVTSATAAQEAGEEMSTGDGRALPWADQFMTQVYQLKYAHPSEVAPLLATFSRNPASGVTAVDSSGILVLRDYASNVKRMTDLLRRIDVTPTTDYKLEVIPVKYGKVDDLYETMSSLVGGGGGGLGGAGGLGGRSNRRTGGAGGRTGTGGNTLQNRYGSTTPGLNTQPGFNTPLGANPGANANAFASRVNQTIRGAVGGGGGGDMQVLGDARIVPDERSNTLLVYASDRDMAMITNIVHRVDQQLAQVLIEAVIMEVQLDKSTSLGVSYLQNPKTTGKLTSASGANNGQTLLSGVTNLSSGLPSGFSYFAKYGGSLEAAVEALSSDSTIEVISRPRLQTSHAVPGTFILGQSVPYITGFQTYAGYVGGASSSSTVQEKEITLDFEVTPYITQDGLVTMDINNKFDQRGTDVTIDGNAYPTVNRREVDSTLTVRDGETIMMGGFISTTKNRSTSGVPGLMNIPLLGALFRSKNDSSTRSELIVLMRVSVLKTPEDASAFARRELKTLPGVRQAQDETARDDAKALKQVEKHEHATENQSTP